MRPGSSGKHRHSSLEASLVNPLVNQAYELDTDHLHANPLPRHLQNQDTVKYVFLINIPEKRPCRVVSCTQSQTRAWDWATEPMGFPPEDTWVDTWGTGKACKIGHLASWRTCHPAHTCCSGALVAAPKVRDWLCSYWDKILPLLVLRSPWL